MRIVIWNCNKALHKKYEHLLALAPDIAVGRLRIRVIVHANHAHGQHLGSVAWLDGYG